ncbi:MAG TPA: carboxymuconolactone decarboxylase family protein, partial [Acidimicrobiales bacterium]|nr:carboxymuconolactone decarboxylase family protein [Acidimicrobiales bacterium]
WVTGSEYEWTQHWRIALGLGLTESDLAGVREWRDHPDFGPAERAVLAAVDETLADGRIGDDTWDACLGHVSSDPRVLLEVISVVGVWGMVAAQLRTIGVPLEEGVAPWPPDGDGPRLR